MANTVWLTRLTSTPICMRGVAVLRRGAHRPAELACSAGRRTAAARCVMPMPAISRSSGPIVPLPIWKRISGNWLGSARGSGEKVSITSWSSTKLMPIVASSGAMRTEFCNGRRPKRSMTRPTSAPSHGHHDDGDGKRRPQLHHRHPADIGAHEIDRAVREVDQPADAEDQGKADRNQRIDVADDQSVDRVVEPGRQTEFLLREAVSGCARRPTISACRPRA